MHIIAVYGLSFSKSVLPVVRQNYPEAKYCFVYDGDVKVTEIYGFDVYSYEDFLDLNVEKKSVVVTIGNSKTREKLVKKCIKDGLNILSVRAENSSVYDNVQIGDGAILCAYTFMGSDVKIGEQFHANIYSYVAHDCVIGNYVTFGPNVSCNGNVHIDDHAYIGTGAILRQGTPDRPLRIGKGAVVGMGAIVLNDVPDGVTVVGNPAKPLLKKS